jgi:two-component system nitrogen regulation response regulator NtrX
LSSRKILIVDDEPDIRQIVGEILEDEGYAVVIAEDAASARQKYEEVLPDLVLLDIWMPGEDGISVLKNWGENAAFQTPVVMISGHGNVETAVEAVKYGAYDFLEKPLSTAKLLLTVERALEADDLRRENRRLRGQFASSRELIGESEAIIELRRHIRLLAPTDSWVFVTGAPGTGKRIVAQAVHDSSDRRDARLVELNLAAAPAESIAVHLFGSESNDEVRAGCFEDAKGGTLFLNEVLDLNLEIQAKLLSALQERRFLRVGGQSYVDLDVRVVSATSHDAEAAVAEGKFREDLYYRLNVVPIHVPQLNQHLEDIPELIDYYIGMIAEREQLPPRTVSAGAMKKMCRYQWPGNVRELTNLLQRLLILNHGNEITEDEVSSSLGQTRASGSSAFGSLGDYVDMGLKEARDQFERSYLEYHLHSVKGSVSKLSQKVGMERTHLYRKLKSLQIDPKSAK